MAVPDFGCALFIHVLLVTCLFAEGTVQDQSQKRMLARPDITKQRLDDAVAPLSRERQPEENKLANLLSRSQSKDGPQRAGLRDDKVSELSTAVKIIPGMLGSLSRSGIVYAKDVLVQKVLRKITPLQLPDLEFNEEAPLGTVSFHLFNITLSGARVKFSDVSLSPTAGVTIIAEGISANISLRWHYNYAHFLHDHGIADIEISGSAVGVRFLLVNENGTLSLQLAESATVLNRLDISARGSAPWVYGFVVHALRKHIKAAVEHSLADVWADAVEELNDFFQDLPRVVPVDATSAINVALVSPLLISPQSLTVGSRMQFVPMANSSQSESFQNIPLELTGDDSHPCGAAGNEMVVIKLSSFVFNSAALVYYQAGYMRYLIDTLPPEVPFGLNTRNWRFILPKLNRMYPDRPMTLDFNATRAPIVSINPLGTGDNFEGGIRAAADVDLFVGVVPTNSKESIRVICLQAEIEVAGSVGLRGNNVTLALHLDKLRLAIKWTKVGRFPVAVLQVMVEAAIRIAVVPMLNHDVRSGFPIPLFEGVELQHSAVAYARDCLVVCTNVSYVGSDGLDRRRGSSMATRSW